MSPNGMICNRRQALVAFTVTSLGGLLNYYGLSSSVIVPAMPSLRHVLLALFVARAAS